MVSKINCVTVMGIEVIPVTVETDLCNGLPSFDMVGLLASDIKESRERVRTAVKNSGYMIPPKRITINFSPGNIRKNGTYFDVAVAVSILHALGVVDCEMKGRLFIGELSLDGNVVKVNGVLPIVLFAVQNGFRQCFVPIDNIGECSFIKEIEVIGVRNLNEVVMVLSGGHLTSGEIKTVPEGHRNHFDFKNIKGQMLARNAAEIAAAGMHNFLMVGPPGTGKSIIAKAMPSILPDMSMDEQIEISRIQSIAGNLKGSLIQCRPFRSPHHTATVAAMIGGGVSPAPGEVTLAHGGILYMDEFPEFSGKVMETLRQPMEEREVHISRSYGTYSFPADFMLVASMNPCRCGYYPNRNRCNCTERDVKKYTEKVSGPILDRIDLCVGMDPVDFSELYDEKEIESSNDIKKRVNKAAGIQRERYAGEDIRYNSQLSGEKIERYCELGAEQKALLKQIYETLNLSVRGYEKLIKVARTIADLEQNEQILCEHITKALAFKVKSQ